MRKPSRRKCKVCGEYFVPKFHDIATGSAQIIINTEDGNFVAVHTVTVT